MYPRLAIDCTDRVSSIAISDGNQLWQIENTEEKRQARKILSLIDECLDKASINKEDLNSLCWAAGPGSFTGLRVATSVAQGLAYALDIPLFAISSLEAMAVALSRIQPNVDGKVLVVTDAYMGEYYWASFQILAQQNKVKRLTEDCLSSIEEIQMPEDAVLVIGNGADKIESESLEKRSDLAMRAQDLMLLAEAQYKQGQQISAMQAEPAYLRSKSAWKTLDQQNSKRA